jgi:hypothetical protein
LQTTLEIQSLIGAWQKSCSQINPADGIFYIGTDIAVSVYAG